MAISNPTRGFGLSIWCFEASEVIDIAAEDTTILRELGPDGLPTVFVTVGHDLTFVPLIATFFPANPVTLQAATSMRLET